MNYIFISPEFPPNFKQFAICLKLEGVNVLGIGSADYDTLETQLQNSLSEYYKVSDMESYQEVFRAVAYFTFKYGKIHRIESHNEHWLELDAKLRTDFNVEGFKIEDVGFVKHKSQMKEVFRSAGIKVAKGNVVKSIKEALELIKVTGYPVVIKPDVGVGASFTYKFHNANELEAFFKDKPVVDYIMEEFIDGEICTFDGIADFNGNISVMSSMHYGLGLMETVNYGADSIFYILKDIPDDVIEMGKKVIKAFNLLERFFHFEFFRLKDGSLVALEINARPPGGLCLDVINYSMDADVYMQYAKIVAGRNPKPLLDRLYNCAFVGLKTRNNPLLNSRENIYEHYGEMIVYDAPNPLLFHEAMGESAIILRSMDIESLSKAVINITKR